MQYVYIFKLLPTTLIQIQIRLYLAALLNTLTFMPYVKLRFDSDCDKEVVEMSSNCNRPKYI